jgi:peroxidase
MSMSTQVRFIVLLGVLLLHQAVNSQLQVGFYHNTCGFAEFIVKEEVRKAFIKDKGMAAGLLHMHFHDCFVRGCDASVLVDSTSTNTAEKDHPANSQSLRGFEVIDRAKQILEILCKGIVSCADILAFAARDSVEITGGHSYDLPAGRRDGRVSLASEVDGNFSPPTFNVHQVTQLFAKKGFTQDEVVTLSGVHTIGRTHCSSFSSRLYSFNSTTTQDPTLDSNYAAILKQQCPQDNPNAVVPMDPSSPATSDANYYVNVLANRGLFTSDQSLLTNTATAKQVHQNARDPTLWKRNFAATMVKMGQMGVLTGSSGEIRANCRAFNS